MEDTNMCYCDKCNRPIDRQTSFEHQNQNLCPDCARALYQKIFGDQEAEHS